MAEYCNWVLLKKKKKYFERVSLLFVYTKEVWFTVESL